MSSPFPGMDPYLEGEMWQEFHERLAHQISTQLMPLLGARYVALLAKRYVLHTADLGIVGLNSTRELYPDVHVAEVPKAQRFLAHTSGSSISAPAVELVS